MATSFVTPVVDPLGAEGAVASAQARNVEPFETSVIGYDTAVLTWTSPAVGAWLGIKIVRSRSGFPRTPDDGALVLSYEHPGWNEQNTFNVTGLSGGYHYFSLFLKDSFGWHRVADADALVPYDYSSTDRMWDNIPEHYRHVQDNTADLSAVNLRINPDFYNGPDSSSRPNLILSAFISLFGWGFDLLRTQAEYVMNGYNPNDIHTSRVDLLSQQFGHVMEQSVPAYTNRTILRNLATLYRGRGTLVGIRDLITAVSGWDVEVGVGSNLLLSEDQSAIVNPASQLWSPTLRYSSGDLVKYGDYTYQSAANNVLGTAPPTTQTSNGTWTYVDYPRVAPTAVRADTGDVGTWQGRLSGAAGVGTYAGMTQAAVGAPDITGTKRQTNVLQVSRLAAAGTLGSSWMDVVSLPASTNTDTQYRYLLESAIPVPKPTTWSSSRSYLAGEYVVYRGAAYQALNNVTGVVPTVTADWVRVGADDRVTLNVSAYAHGPFTGTAGSGGKTVQAKAVSYVSTGAVQREYTFTSTTVVPFFDPFVDDATTLSSGRVLATGQSWSSDGVGSWSIDRNDVGGWSAPPVSGKAQRWVVSSTNPVNIAVTFTEDPGTTRLVGIVFLRTDANNYWIATQTGLYKVVAGAARANPASGALTWTKFTTGERMRVQVDTGNVIRVYRNATLLGTATDAFNAAGTHYGLGAEA